MLEQGCEDVQGEFADCVLGGAPVAYECPLHHRAHLGFPGHGKLAGIGYLVFQGLGEAGSYELVDIFDMVGVVC